MLVRKIKCMTYKIYKVKMDFSKTIKNLIFIIRHLESLG